MKAGIFLMLGVVGICVVTSAAVVTDSFDTANTANLNTGLAARQTGTLAGSFTYTGSGDTLDKTRIQENALEVKLVQNVTSRDLVSQLADSTYTISVDIGWYDQGGTTANHSYYMNLGGAGKGNVKDKTVPLQIGMTTDGGSNGQFFVGLGTGASFITLATVDVSGGNDRSKFWNVTLAIDESGAMDTLASVSFDGNDLKLVGDTTIHFGAGRELYFSTKGSGMFGRFDNLRVVPEPATVGLISAFGGATVFVRRRFTNN